MNRAKRVVSAVVSALMIVSAVSFSTPVPVRADGGQAIPSCEGQMDFSTRAPLFVAPWGNASYNKSTRSISGNTTVSGTGGNRNAISELYFGEFSEEGNAYYSDFEIEIAKDDVDLTTWSTQKNHYLGIILGTAQDRAFKVWLRLTGSNDILLGYSNDAATRKMSTALNGKRIMGLGTEAGTYWLRSGLGDYMTTEGDLYKMHVVSALDVEAQTLSLWINDVLVFDKADVKGSQGLAEYGDIAPAFGVDVESTSSERVLCPIIRINSMWCTGIPNGSYDETLHDYSDAGVFSSAWVNTAAYDAAAKTVWTNTGMSNPNSISELYMFGLDRLEKDYCAEFELYLPVDRIDLTAWGASSQRLDIILGTAGEYVYKMQLRLNGSDDILLTYSTDTVCRNGLGESLSGHRIMGNNTTGGWFNTFSGLSSFFEIEDGMYRLNIRTKMDIEDQTMSVWVNGTKVLSKVNMKGSGGAATYGPVSPALGFVTESGSSSNVMNARVDVRHVWSSETKEYSSYITPRRSCFVGDGLSSADETIILNSSGERGTLQGDAVFFDDLVFEDRNNYILSAKLRILDHFNGSPVNSTNPGLVSLIFAQRGNGSDILEVAVRPSISGQYGIIQAKTRLRWSSIIAGSFTNQTEPGGNAMMISSRLGTCPAFSMKETDGAFEYPDEAVLKVVYFNGRVSAYINNNVLFANERITPDETDGLFRPTLGFAAYNYKVELSDIRAYGAKESAPDEPEKLPLLTDAPFDPDNIVMRIGVLSDPHISYSSFDEAGIRKAADSFIDAVYNTNAAAAGGLDGIMLLGDYTSTGTVNQAVSFINVYNAAVNAAFGDRTPALSLAYGNHDTEWGNCLQPEEWDTLLLGGAALISAQEGWKIAADPSEAVIPALKGFARSDSGYNATAPAGCQDTVITKIVKGVDYSYHLISIETDTYNYYGTNSFRQIVLDWLDDTLRAITESSPGQYVYIGMHAPIREGGTFGSKLYEDLNSDWGSAKGNIKGISGNIDGVLKKYPQAVVLTGHTHYKEYLNTTIMQDNYTEINVCASGGSGGLNGGKVNIEGNYDGTDRGMTVLIEIDADGNQRITRLDMNKAQAGVDAELTLVQVNNQSSAAGESDYPLIWAISEASAGYTTDTETSHGEVTPAWITPAPKAGSRDNLRYYSAARGEGNTVEYPSGSAITYTELSRKGSSTTFEVKFPAALSADPNVFVMYYVIRAFDSENSELVLTHPGASNTDYKGLWTYGNWNPVREGTDDGDSHLNATKYSYGGITVNTSGEFSLSITPIDEYGNTGAPLTLSVAKPEATLTGIAVKTNPAKTSYIEGKDAFDPAGGVITATYDDDTTEDIAMTADMVTGFDNATVGEQTLTVTYEGKTATFKVTVAAKAVTSIAIKSQPSKVTYLEGKDAFDPAGGVITAAYNDDSTADIAITAEMVSGFDNTKVGAQTLTVTYEGKTATFGVNVAARKVTGIAVTAPAKTSYLEGKDAFDPAGGKVTVTYDNGTSETIDLTAAMVSGFDNAKVGEQTLTVTYDGKTATFNVTITAKSLTGIAVKTNPTKTEYLEGKDTFDPAGGVITASYDNDTTEDIAMTAEMVTGFDNTKVGEQELTVSYGGKTAAFKVTVTAKVAQAGGYDAVKDIQKDDTTSYGADKFVVRSAGDLRFDTALKTAEDLKIALAADKFENIIVAASHNFPDALGGSYLAARKSAPILIVRTGDKTQGVDKAVDFIKKNLAANGTVYILGGESAVSAAAAAEINKSGVAGIKVKRLAGTDRYGTNLEILKEAGVDAGADLLVADARNFADALSASALGKPILLINNKKTELTADQKAFLNGKSFGKIYVLGGVAAVPEAIVSSIKASLPGTESKRLAGDGRYETSIAIAKEFFPNPEVITLATGTGFPDGLTGGSLAFGLNAPLILTREKNMDLAAKYAQAAGVKKFVVFGGESAMPGKVVSTIVGK